MTLHTTTQILVRDRQRRLEDAADRYRQAHQLPVAARAPLRTGAGWLLVRAGLRLAAVDRRPPSATMART
jgi:hypothetical protein